MLVSGLVLLWLIGFPTTVGFIAGILEKRLVWPYSPLEDRHDAPVGRRDDDNPFAPPNTSNPLPTSDYVEVTNRHAMQQGFTPLGTFQNVTSKLYRVRYAFWLSPDRRVLAVVSTGTLAAIPLNLTSLITRTGDGEYIHSVDDFKGLASDPSGLARSDVLSNADFEELLAWHLERVASAPRPGLPYPQDDPLGEHRRLQQIRLDRLEKRGFARYLDPERRSMEVDGPGGVRGRDPLDPAAIPPARPQYWPQNDTPAWRRRLRTFPPAIETRGTRRGAGRVADVLHDCACPGRRSWGSPDLNPGRRRRYCFAMRRRGWH